MGESSAAQVCSDREFVEHEGIFATTFEERIAQLAAIADLLQNHKGDIEESNAEAIGNLLSELATDMSYNIQPVMQGAFERLGSLVGVEGEPEGDAAPGLSLVERETPDSE